MYYMELVNMCNANLRALKKRLRKKPVGALFPREAIKRTVCSLNQSLNYL